MKIFFENAILDLLKLYRDAVLNNKIKDPNEGIARIEQTFA